MEKSPCTRALTPVEVKESIERLVGSNLVACIAYSSTVAGARNPSTIMSTATIQSSSSATILGHLLALPLFLPWNARRSEAADGCLVASGVEEASRSSVG